MARPKALLFDVGGTVFDWKSTVIDAVKPLITANTPLDTALEFAEDWRAEMFARRKQIADGHLKWENSDAMLLAGLEALQPKYSFLKKLGSQTTFVKEVWHNLQTFDGAVNSILALKDNYTVCVLTILSWASIVHSSKRANLQWDGILSCEFLGYYKPSLMAYTRAVNLLGLHPEDVMMIASHETDLAAAKMAGLRTAFIKPASEDRIFSADFASEDAFKFDVVASDFHDLHAKLENTP